MHYMGETLWSGREESLSFSALVTLAEGKAVSRRGLVLIAQQSGQWGS